MVSTSRKNGRSALLEQPTTVAIVGAGFSGTVLAIYILRHSAHKVLLVNAAERFGPGVAYATSCPEHRLNVPAGKMSALAELPDHFLHWCQERTPLEAGAGTFVSRTHYGDYLTQLLTEAADERLVRLSGQVHDAVPLPGGGFELHFGHGPTVRCERLVLAVGNCRPSPIPVEFGGEFYASGRYLGDPWDPAAVRNLDASQAVLLFGTGLTMVDKVLELRAAGFCGPLVALSRRGLLPLPHAPGAAPFAFAPSELPLTVRALCQQVRAAIAGRGGRDWQAVIDALRPQTVTHWQALPLVERRRFLRHLRPYWEVVRHRIAPAVHEAIVRELAGGGLAMRAGRLVGFREHPDAVTVHWRPRGTDEIQTVTVQRVINCTGPECRLEHRKNPLLVNLRRRGLLCPDDLGLGVRADAHGALIDTAGRTSDRLFTLGGLLRGQRWESTAVPELREQARQLGALLARLPACE